MSDTTFNLVKKATNLSTPSDSVVNDAMAKFGYFLYEINVPIICFSSFSQKHVWCFSKAGENLFIDFYRNSSIKPYIDMRKGIFDAKFNAKYLWIIDNICDNLNTVRHQAKKEDIINYPTEDDVRCSFWSNIVYKTNLDFSVLPGLSHLLKTSLDDSLTELLLRSDSRDIIYLDRLIYNEYQSISNKWKMIIAKMQQLRRQEVDPRNMTSLKGSFNITKLREFLVNTAPPETEFTSGLTPKKVIARKREREKYYKDEIERILSVAHELEHAGIAYGTLQQSSEEIYTNAIKTITTCDTEDKHTSK